MVASRTDFESPIQNPCKSVTSLQKGHFYREGATLAPGASAGEDTKIFKNQVWHLHALPPTDLDSLREHVKILRALRFFAVKGGFFQ